MNVGLETCFVKYILPGAREYLGELYVETGDLPKARDQLAVLEKLCPQGCEEREDLEQAIAAAVPKTN